MEILVFKTNLRYKKHIAHIVPQLESIEGIHAWNVDLKDRDKVLRIEAINVIASSVQGVLQKAGYYCEEMED